MASRFWSLLGRSVAKGHARSRRAVADAGSVDVDTVTADALREKFDLPRFLALARETADTAIGLRPFDTQLYAAVRLL